MLYVCVFLIQTGIKEDKKKQQQNVCASGVVVVVCGEIKHHKHRAQYWPCVSFFSSSCVFIFRNRYFSLSLKYLNGMENKEEREESWEKKRTVDLSRFDLVACVFLLLRVVLSFFPPSLGFVLNRHSSCFRVRFVFSFFFSYLIGRLI